MHLAALREFLTDPSHLAHYEVNWKTIPVDFDRFVLQRAYWKLGTPTLPREFCWFHCSRVRPGRGRPDSPHCLWTSNLQRAHRFARLPLGAVAPGLQERLVAELEDETGKEAVRRAFASRGRCSLSSHIASRRPEFIVSRVGAPPPGVS